jgi:periplasmic divalent cation tolerance protein
MLLIGWTTVGTRDQAEVLAKGLVDAQLAACVQVEGPITSFYTWEGKATRAEEYRLCVKLLPARVRALEEWITRHHPYDTPEWLVVPAERVAQKYLSWARANCTSAPFTESKSSI